MFSNDSGRSNNDDFNRRDSEMRRGRDCWGASRNDSRDGRDNNYSSRGDDGYRYHMNDDRDRRWQGNQNYSDGNTINFKMMIMFSTNIFVYEFYVFLCVHGFKYELLVYI